MGKISLGRVPVMGGAEGWNVRIERLAAVSPQKARKALQGSLDCLAVSQTLKDSR